MLATSPCSCCICVAFRNRRLRVRGPGPEKSPTASVDTRIDTRDPSRRCSAVPGTERCPVCCKVCCSGERAPAGTSAEWDAEGRRGALVVCVYYCLVCCPPRGQKGSALTPPSVGEVGVTLTVESTFSPLTQEHKKQPGIHPSCLKIEGGQASLEKR